MAEIKIKTAAEIQYKWRQKIIYNGRINKKLQQQIKLQLRQNIADETIRVPERINGKNASTERKHQQREHNNGDETKNNEIPLGYHRILSM